jgi:predicted double-glycine peptidase
MASYAVKRIAAGTAIALAAVCASTAAAAQVRLPESSAVVQVMTWRDIPFRSVVRQQYDYSCGSAALATLLTYGYGVKTSEAETFTAMYAAGDQAKIRKIGFSLLDMKRYADSHGFKATGYRVNLDEIARGGVPVIALINLGPYRHFVVIKGVAGDKVLMGDPALGLKTVSRADFGKMWNGVVLQIEPAGAEHTARFNVASEWDPWARAPTRRVADTTTNLTTLTTNQFVLYQITPLIDPGVVNPGG